MACAVKAWFHLQWCTVFLGLQWRSVKCHRILRENNAINQAILWGKELLELERDKSAQIKKCNRHAPFLMLLFTLNHLEQHVGFLYVLLLVMPFESLTLCRLCLAVFSLGWCAENLPLTQSQGLISYYHPQFLTQNLMLLAKGILQNCIQSSLVIKSSRNPRLVRLRLGALLFRLAAAHADMWVMLLLLLHLLWATSCKQLSAHESTSRNKTTWLRTILPRAWYTELPWASLQTCKYLHMLVTASLSLLWPGFGNLQANHLSSMPAITRKHKLLQVPVIVTRIWVTPVTSAHVALCLTAATRHEHKVSHLFRLALRSQCSHIPASCSFLALFF